MDDAPADPRAWTEVRVLVPLGWQELVADALRVLPHQGFAFGRPSLGTPEPPPDHDWVRTFVPAAEDRPELREDLRRALAELPARAGAAELEGLEPIFRELPPEDWARSWRKVWRPFRIDRLAVLPVEGGPAPRAGDVVLRIEPGGAFGTGRHATTRACLRALSRNLRGGERVLDAGCGSGILAVGAVLLGARECVGFDVDPVAVAHAEELGRRNGVETACAWRTGGFEVLAEDEAPFDVLVANLYADVLQSHAGRLRGALRPGGWFALSGISTARLEATLAAVEDAGLAIERRHRRGRWHTLAGSRPSAG